MGATGSRAAAEEEYSIQRQSALGRTIEPPGAGSLPAQRVLANPINYKAVPSTFVVVRNRRY
jgi:hypothetical protein